MNAEYRGRGVPRRAGRPYKHIIDDDDELNAMREYITNNPLRWDADEENPIS